MIVYTLEQCDECSMMIQNKGCGDYKPDETEWEVLYKTMYNIHTMTTYKTSTHNTQHTID